MRMGREVRQMRKAKLVILIAGWSVVLRFASWDVDETTPVCSPAPSAAVSRTPTLVDLVAYGHEG
jgi:hypothetical protein